MVVAFMQIKLREYPCLQAEIAELKREMKTNGGLENSDE